MKIAILFGGKTIGILHEGKTDGGCSNNEGNNQNFDHEKGSIGPPKRDGF